MKIFEKIIICDDHSIIRSSLVEMLKGRFPSSIIHEAQNGDEATNLFKKNNYDLAILDVIMPDYEPVGFIEYLTIQHPDTKILIFSMCSEEIFGKRFIKLGAKGFVSKSENITKINSALDLMLEGRVYMSPTLNELFISESIDGKSKDLYSLLSDRELEVMMLLIKGNSTSEISDMMNLQNSTIATYKKRLFEKLGVDNIVELVHLSISHGLM